MRWPLLCLLLCSLTACLPQVEIQNTRLATGQLNYGPPPPDWQPDRPLVLLAFSGGGARAAAFAYDTLEELNNVPDGTGRTLLDDVAVISSVSGGSVTAAYFGLYGKAGLPTLYQNFLLQDNMWRIESQLLNPIVDAKLVAGAMGRVDAQRNVLNDELFHDKTFAALQGKNRPVILLNATDMASGDIFVFGPTRFDDICSDLASLPIATAVAASSAFPILTSPITLQDYSGPDCPQNRAGAALFGYVQGNAKAPFVNLDQYEQYLYQNDLQHGPAARTDMRYIHLLDGGLADNLGVTTLGAVMTTGDKDAKILDIFNLPTHPRKIVVISVRARSFVESSLYTQKSAPGEIAMVEAVTGIPLDANTGALDDNFASLNQDIADSLGAIATIYKETPSRMYYIDIDPDQLEGNQASLRAGVEAVPTSWTVTKPQLDTIQTAVHDLLAINPDYQALLSGL